MKRTLCALLCVGALLLTCTACGNSAAQEELASLRQENEALQTRLAQSESQRLTDAADFQRQLEAMTVISGQEPPPRAQLSDFAAALADGKIHSVLVLGDSISDGNGDRGCLYEQSDRAAAGNRLIITEGEEAFYENAANSQGWVTYLREYLEEHTTLDTFHNNAIGGKSAKWFNAHKEAVIPQRYDAIFVMLGTNDRTDCQTADEFYTEYGRLLSYAAEQCEILTVLAPIPAVYDVTDSEKNIDSQTIADTVLRLCEANGWACVNCYEALPSYAAQSGDSLGSYYFGGTHPNYMGYAAIWRMLAGQLGLLLDAEQPADITCIGDNRDDIDGDLPLDALDAQGQPIYPVGVSWYYTWNAFTGALPNGAFIETHRNEDGTAVQYARNHGFQQDRFSYARTYENGAWSEWYYAD